MKMKKLAMVISAMFALNMAGTVFAADSDINARIANLEKQIAELKAAQTQIQAKAPAASNIKFSGNARLRYIHVQNATNNPTFGERVNLYLDGKVSDNVTFHIQDRLVDQGEGFGNYTTNKGLENLIAEANFTYKNALPGIDITAGRNHLNLGQTTYLAGTTGGLDGIQGVYANGKANLLFGYADASLLETGATVSGNSVSGYLGAPSTFNGVNNVYFSQFNYTPDKKVTFDLNLLTAESGVNKDILNISGFGVKWGFAKDWNFIGDYWQNSGSAAKVNGNTPKAYVARVAYKGANMAVPGSWGAFVERVYCEKNTYDGNWTGSMNFMGDNKKLYSLEYDRTLAKNVNVNFIYSWDFQQTDNGANLDANLTRIQLNFAF